MPDLPEMVPVSSSNVAAIGYDPTKQKLFIEWHSNRLSMYFDVPEVVASSIMHASSVGKAVHEQLKGRYTHEYLEG